MGVLLSLLGISALLGLTNAVKEAPRPTGSDVRDTTEWTAVEFDKRNVSLRCAVDTHGLPLLHVGWYLCKIQMVHECSSGSEKRKIAHIENMMNVSILRPDEFNLTPNGSLIILKILPKYNRKVFLCKGKVRFHRLHENFTILHIVFPSTPRPSQRPTTSVFPSTSRTVLRVITSDTPIAASSSSSDTPIATGLSSSGISGFTRSPPPVLGGSKKEVNFATAFHKVLPLNIFLFVLLAIAVVIIILLVIKIKRHGEGNLNDAPDRGIPMQPFTNDGFNPPNRE